MLTCATCGNQEPDGSQFCGNCSAPFPAEEQPPPAVEPGRTPPPSGQHRLRWFAVGAAIALLVAGGVVAAALSLTGGGDSTEAVTTSSGQTVSSEEDCAALSPVLTHLGLAADPSSSDGWVVYAYGPDREFLDDYANRAPDEVSADVSRLRDFLDRYATAAQAAGAESGQFPEQDQLDEIKTELNLSSGEQDDLRTSIQILLAWMGDGCVSGGSSPSDTTSSDGESVTAEDCRALGSVVADFTVGAHPDTVFNLALDISASDYLVDRDFLDSYSDRAPAEIRADVLRLGRFLDEFASAAQAAGIEPGANQLGELRVAGNLGSVEADQLPGSIEALGIWAANGCSGGRPPSETTPSAGLPAPTTEPETIEPGLLSATDEEVTAAMNYAMSQRTEEEFGSSPLGAEVRDCRKDRDVSEDSLLAPGGRLYTCEVWFEDELWSDAGLAAIGSDGNVYVAP